MLIPFITAIVLLILGVFLAVVVTPFQREKCDNEWRAISAGKKRGARSRGGGGATGRIHVSAQLVVHRALQVSYFNAVFSTRRRLCLQLRYVTEKLLGEGQALRSITAEPEDENATEIPYTLIPPTNRACGRCRIPQTHVNPAPAEWCGDRCKKKKKGKNQTKPKTNALLRAAVLEDKSKRNNAVPSSCRKAPLCNSNVGKLEDLLRQTLHNGGDIEATAQLCGR